MTVVVSHDWSAGSLADLSMEGRIEQASRAQAVAVAVHRRRRLSGGGTMLDHLATIAYGFDPIDQTAECCVAWLHHAVEVRGVDFELLYDAGIHPEILDALHEFSGTSDGEGQRNAPDNPITRAVLIAHIHDDVDPDALSLLAPEERADRESSSRRLLQQLGEDWPDHRFTGQAGGSTFGHLS